MISCCAFLYPTRYFPSFLSPDGARYSDLCYFPLLTTPHPSHPPLLHTQPWVYLDIRDHVLNMFACKHVVSQVCASVLGRVHRHFSILSPRRFVCDGFWRGGEFLIDVKHVSVSTLNKDSGYYFNRHFIRCNGAVRRKKITYKIFPGEKGGILESKQRRRENKRERNYINPAASVCFSWHLVTYLTPQWWLELKGELTVSLPFSDLSWPKPCLCPSSCI